MAAAAAAIAVSSVGIGLYQGQRQASMQSRALGAQAQAQRDAASMAASQQRRAEQELAKANRKRVDPGSLLTSEQEFAQRKGIQSTLLTGSIGVPPGTGKLAQQSLLGGPIQQ